MTTIPRDSDDIHLALPLAPYVTDHSIHQLAVWFALGGVATTTQRDEAMRRDVAMSSLTTLGYRA
jgi:hypothetical protein